MHLRLQKPRAPEFCRREARPGAVTTYRTVQEMIRELPAMLQKGDGLLVKGSRKLNLEQVTDFLLQRYQGGGQRELAG